MKKLSILFAFIFLSSFTPISEPRVLPNGFYKVVLEEKFQNMELNNFEFFLENDKFTMQIAHKWETLEIEWLDENSFVVKGYTEPKSPNEFEQRMLKNYRPTFNITNSKEDEYHFTLGEESEKSPIFSGKLIKSE